MRSPGSSRKYRDRSAIVSADDQIRWLIVPSCFVALLPVSQTRAFCNRFSEVKSLGASGCNARGPQSPKSTLLRSSRLAAGHKVLAEERTRFAGGERGVGERVVAQLLRFD